MLTKRMGGLTEFIPTPQEKRDGLIRDHTLALLRNLHERVCLAEQRSGSPSAAAGDFDRLWEQIEREEAEARRIQTEAIPQE